MPGIDQELKSRFESEQQKAMLNIMFTANWLKSIQVGLFKPFGISPQQYNILRILRGAKGKMNMHNVKQRMIDRAPNATRLTDKLISKKLVERERCEEDRRVVYVRISEKGLGLLERIDRKMRSQIQDSMKHLNDQDSVDLNRILDTLRG
jgi:DNA-binding MarR family transcriptional regulator